jgi:hypothetical protein
MTWMFRWLSVLLSRVRPREGTASNNAWVEPSNAITRAILSGAVAELPPLPLEQAPGEIVPMTQKTAAPATRTAQRVRRRRAGRAA